MLGDPFGGMHHGKVMIIIVVLCSTSLCSLYRLEAAMGGLCCLSRDRAACPSKDQEVQTSSSSCLHCCHVADTLATARASIRDLRSTALLSNAEAKEALDRHRAAIARRAAGDQ